MENNSNLSFIVISKKRNFSGLGSEEQILTFFKKWQITPHILTGIYSELSELLDQAPMGPIILLPEELSTPLGDLFNLMQTLHSQPEVKFVFGDRFSKKQNSNASANSTRLKMDTFFLPIYRQNLANLFADPLCDSLALHKASWQELSLHDKTTVNSLKWTPAFMRLCLKHKWSSVDIPINDNGASPQGISRLKMIYAYLKNLR